MRVLLSLLILISVVFSSSLLAEEHWSQFRGPAGDGHVRAGNLPLKWSETQNVVWKTSIHDRGWSSPVIWGNQVWMTTSTADGHKLFAVCVDRDSGKIVHDIHVFDVERPESISVQNSYASPTSVIEEGRVYVHYGTYGTACIDSGTGKLLWTRRDMKCAHEAGAGSSPFLMGNLFIVNVDGRDVQYVIALDKATGKTVWKTNRSADYSKTPINQRKAYSMPIVVPRGSGQQLVSPGAKAVFAYDPATGKELWQVRHRGWSMAPRPVFGFGMVFVVMDYDVPELWAIRPDGTGDVTDSKVVWKITKGAPSRSSPLLVDDLLFLVTAGGVATCVEAKTGKVVWKERINGKYSASPIYANGRIYFFDENAVSTVINPARKFEVLAVNSLAKDQLRASPAVSGKSLFVRTEKHLYRIDNSAAK
jgi:outer membrane protein assembly factor BamB